MNKTPMNKLIARPMGSLLALFAVGVISLAGCTAVPFQADAGDVITEEMDFTDFDQVEISDAFSVEIRQGDEFRVTISVDGGSRRYLEANRRGDTLEIGMRPRPGIIFWPYVTVHRAEITMPSLTGLAVSDASHVQVSGFDTDADVQFEVDDASSLNGEMDSGDTDITAADASEVRLEGDRGDVEIEVSDSSHVTLVGEGRNVTVRVADASSADLADFRVQDADLHAQDASEITVDVAGRLDAEAEDASSIIYYGDPTIGNTMSSDASSIRARER